MIEPVWGWVADNLSELAQAASVASGAAAAIGLIFNAFQFRDQRRSIDLRTSLDLCAEVENRFDEFCRARIEALDAESDEASNGSRELINLMSLFEQISFATNKGMLTGRSRRLLVDQVSDLIDKLVADEFAREAIKNSRERPDIYSEIKSFIIKRRRRFSHFELVRLSFGIRKLNFLELVVDWRFRNKVTVN